MVNIRLSGVHGYANARFRYLAEFPPCDWTNIIGGRNEFFLVSLTNVPGAYLADSMILSSHLRSITLNLDL